MTRSERLFEIAGRKIGPGHPCYVIAEMSGNHGGSLDTALHMVEVAHASGADAIKLQTYTADTITLNSSKPAFQINSGTLWDGKVLHALYQEAHTPWEWQPKLKARADALGIHCFSSPFDATAVDFLMQMNVPAFKIASFELVDLPLIRTVAKTALPMIMSTGMARLAEIEEAVRVAREAGAVQLALLVCSSAYPSPPSAIHLARIKHLADTFDVVVGLSDHTLGTAVPTAAAALGACIIEKHFCLSREDPGPDTAFSLEPHELAQMVTDVRVAQSAVGSVRYGHSGAEDSSRVFRRSLFVVKDIKRGEVFSAHNIRSIRPAHGLHTRHLDEVLGRVCALDVEAGTPLQWSMVQ